MRWRDSVANQYVTCVCFDVKSAIFFSSSEVPKRSISSKYGKGCRWYSGLRLYLVESGGS